MFAAKLSAAVTLGAALVSAQTGTFPAGVVGTGTMGKTNPTQAVTDTKVDQESMSRLLTLNSVDDFCIFAPPTLQDIANSETIEVAWCTKPRNNARVIPDGTLTGVSFLKTDMYVQIMGYGDFTKINIPYGDMGGELDPHGAYGDGNPIGGNVTTNVPGSELNVAEWMQFISYNQFCIRACTNANGTFDAPSMCEHKLDEVGCMFVMPGNYNFNGTFETCEAEVALPPGWYPTATVDGKVEYSTFAQYFTGVYTANGTPVSYTVGTTVTPTGAAFTPSSSNCKTVPTVSNGLVVPSAGAGSGAQSGGSAGSSPTPTGSGGAAGGAKNTSAAGSKGASSGSPSESGSAGHRNLPGLFPGMGALVGLTFTSVLAVAAGAVMVL